HSRRSGARRAIPGERLPVTERPRPLLGLVDLDLMPDVVGRISDLLSDADRARLVAREERRVVAVKAVADRLHVTLVALRSVLILAMVLGSHDRVIAVHLGVAIELVRHVEARVGAVAVSADGIAVPAGDVEDRPVDLLHRLERPGERGENAAHPAL